MVNFDCGKARRRAGLFETPYFNRRLKFFVEVAHRAGDIDSAWNAALAVLHALDDACRLVALGTVGRLRRVHHLLAVPCFCNLGHLAVFLLLGLSLRTSAAANGFNGAVIGSPSAAKAFPGRQRDSLPPVYIRAARAVSARQFVCSVSAGGGCGGETGRICTSAGAAGSAGPIAASCWRRAAASRSTGMPPGTITGAL